MTHLAGTSSDGRATNSQNYNLGRCFSVTILRTQGNTRQRLFKSLCCFRRKGRNFDFELARRDLLMRGLEGSVGSDRGGRKRNRTVPIVNDTVMLRRVTGAPVADNANNTGS